MDRVEENGDDKASSEEIELREVAPENAGFAAKAKRHCARFWWLHLTIFCVIFLIIALCLVYVAMPRIAQHGVDETSLEVTDLQFLSPTETSLVLTQKAILNSPSIFTPTLDSFTASFWLVTNGIFGAAPMLDIQMPSIHALHPTSNASVLNQLVTVSNLDQVTAFSIATLTQENVTTALTGRTKLREGKLPVNWVNYNTTTTFKGLNGLQGFNVTGVILNLTAAAGQPNLKGFVYIPNASLMTIEMGNVTLSLSTAKAGVVGNSTILNMTLKPGNNTLPMTAIIDQAKVTDSLNSSGIATLQIAGTSAVYNGQHLTYYEKALASNVLSLDMNVVQVLKDSAAAAASNSTSA